MNEEARNKNKKVQKFYSHDGRNVIEMEKGSKTLKMNILGIFKLIRQKFDSGMLISGRKKLKRIIFELMDKIWRDREPILTMWKMESF